MSVTAQSGSAQRLGVAIEFIETLIEFSGGNFAQFGFDGKGCFRFNPSKMLEVASKLVWR